MLAAVVVLLIFVVIHTWIVRAANPLLTATTSALVAFIAGFGGYTIGAFRRAA
jgi:hypothetical protein